MYLYHFSSVALETFLIKVYYDQISSGLDRNSRFIEQIGDDKLLEWNSDEEHFTTFTLTNDKTIFAFRFPQFF